MKETQEQRQFRLMAEATWIQALGTVGTIGVAIRESGDFAPEMWLWAFITGLIFVLVGYIALLAGSKIMTLIVLWLTFLTIMMVMVALVALYIRSYPEYTLAAGLTTTFGSLLLRYWRNWNS